MIKEIKIQSVATYDADMPEAMDELEKINFIYGANGTGKTTISRVIANPESHPDCEVVWHGGTNLETRVYNRDFIEKNFNQSDELKGVFTLGEEDKEAVENIRKAKRDLTLIQATIGSLTVTLNGKEGNEGKSKKLKTLEKDFEKKCWKLQQRHKLKFKDAFVGHMGGKVDFKKKLIGESASNSATYISLTDIEKNAETVFGASPKQESPIGIPDCKSILSHETNTILKKKIIGKSDVDIAAMIEKLGNSDWVKQGRYFYNPNDPVCPFCQQNTDESLEKSLNKYFDETFEEDMRTIETLREAYISDSNRLQQELQTLLANPSNFLDKVKLQKEKDLIESKIRINKEHIDGKKREQSKQINLDSLKDSINTIDIILEDANNEIKKHNDIVSNLQKEKSKLKKQVWKFLIDEINGDLKIYKNEKSDLEKAISHLNERIKEEERKKEDKEQEIQTIEAEITSIQPTIDRINEMLRSLGFQGFILAKSDDRFYKVQRRDGSDAKETLSEGEQSFITFLYFYYLLQGGESESGISSDRIVVFDDPVSSLDSDILFIVNQLIQKIITDVRKQRGMIKQVFILTHNVYFHKEVSFNGKRPAGSKFTNETFWIVRKVDQNSKLEKHDKNPIKNSYELLWAEVKNSNRHDLSIQNTLRRILEYYYKILGNIELNKICDEFDGTEKSICGALLSWAHEGSHFADDPLYAPKSDVAIDNYLRVFERIFQKTGHITHYNMMMGK